MSVTFVRNDCFIFNTDLFYNKIMSNKIIIVSYLCAQKNAKFYNVEQ